jgi:transcriptional regulator NrdR family protein
MSEKNKICLGLCPHCNSEDIEYYDSELDGDGVIYKGSCNSCEGTFVEEFDLHYIRTSYEGED